MPTILVAHDENRVIGNNKEIPWKISEDLKRFKYLTTGRTVIMGRKTYESLPKRPLSNRTNIVISRNVRPTTEGNLIIVNDIQQAMFFCNKGNEAFIIGGEQIYKLALQYKVADRILATIVHGKHEGDTFFPVIDMEEWIETKLEQNNVFDYIEYRRKK